MYSRVVSDQAERGVALIEEFSGHLTKDEDQLQFLLQVVQEHRRAYPNVLKKTLQHELSDSSYSD